MTSGSGAGAFVGELGAGPALSISMPGGSLPARPPRSGRCQRIGDGRSSLLNFFATRFQLPGQARRECSDRHPSIDLPHAHKCGGVRCARGCKIVVSACQ